MVLVGGFLRFDDIVLWKMFSRAMRHVLMLIVIAMIHLEECKGWRIFASVGGMDVAEKSVQERMHKR